MGKHMSKAKASNKVSSMEAIVVPLGVCTRARTLALRKQQIRTQGQQGEGSVKLYLELRSRKIEKMSSQKVAMRRRYNREMTEKDEEEASLGENQLTLESMEKSARETTPPCNLITTINGSTTRPRRSTYCGMAQARERYTTTGLDKFNEFFAAEMRRDQEAFMDKYNFDPVNDCPLSGRYEWVKLK